MLSAPQSNNTNSENGSFETPVLSVSDRKRKNTRAVEHVPSIAKRPRGRSSTTSRKTSWLIFHEIVDLSSNHFEGQIPEVMMNFKALHVLNSSNNYLR